MAWFTSKIVNDLILLVFIALAAVKFTYSVDTVIDIRPFDETFYLENGVRLLEWGLPKDSWASLYVIWYYLLSLAEADKIKLYYFSYQVLVIGSTLLFYLLLRGLKAHLFIAALATVLYLVSNSLQAWPYIGVFAAVVMLFVFNVAIRVWSEDSTYLIGGLGILVLSFVRAEYVLALIVLVAWLLIKNLTSRCGVPVFRRLGVYKLALLLTFATVLLYGFGNPLSGNRGWVAFGQHFAMNYAVWNNLDLLAMGVNWQETTRMCFGNASSIGQAFVINRELFTKHMVENAITLVGAAVTNPFVTPLSFLSAQASSVIAWLELSLLCGFGVFLAQTSVAEPRIIKDAVPKKVLILSGIVCVPNIASAIIIYPRWHYLIIPTTVALVLFWACVSATMERKFQYTMKPAEAVVAGLLMLCVVPNLSHGWMPALTTSIRDAGGRVVDYRTEGIDDFERDRANIRLANTRADGQKAKTQDFDDVVYFPTWTNIRNYWVPGFSTRNNGNRRVLENRAVVNFLRELKIATNVTILEAPGYSAYMTNNYVAIRPWEKNRPFQEFVRGRKIDMIIVDEFFAADRGIKNDVEFFKFLKSFNDEGYKRHDLLGSGRSVFVKTELLSSVESTKARR
jgi:hypothetical protein